MTTQTQCCSIQCCLLQHITEYVIITLEVYEFCFNVRNQKQEAMKHHIFKMQQQYLNNVFGYQINLLSTIKKDKDVWKLITLIKSHN